MAKKRIIFCRSSECHTQNINLWNIRVDDELRKAEWHEIENCCQNLRSFQHLLEGDVIFVGCGRNVIGNFLLAQVKGRITFADIREEILWQGTEAVQKEKEIGLAIKLAMMQLKFRDSFRELTNYDIFRKNTEEYLSALKHVGPNPFKV
ncbi:MAG: hypothetical protein JG781_1546 [Peptococcaceae bacterium]|jgi:hypothetical protein|nr:hypothetical protein [Peptococcaceae bacterium]